MRIISRKALRELWERHEDAEHPLRVWFKEAREATWKSPGDIKAQYGSASVLPNNRVVFNVKGNEYRLVVAVRYDLGIVFVRFVGKHSQYDEIDATTI
jgi:mRNA interferase HigB